MASSEQIAGKMLGNPLSVGIKTVTAEILGGRSAAYRLVTSPQAFRLGVIGVFTIVDLLNPDIRSLGILLCGTEAIARAYRNDRYGTGRIALSERLAAFGIDGLAEGDIGIIRAGAWLETGVGAKKLFAVTHDQKFLDRFARVRKGAAVFPVIRDDGKAAVMLER